MDRRQNLRTGVPSVSPSFDTRSMSVVNRGNKFCCRAPRQPISALILAPTCSRKEDNRGLSRMWSNARRSSSNATDRSPNKRTLHDLILSSEECILGIETSSDCVLNQRTIWFRRPWSVLTLPSQLHSWHTPQLLTIISGGEVSMLTCAYCQLR